MRKLSAEKDRALRRAAREGNYTVGAVGGAVFLVPYTDYFVIEAQGQHFGLMTCKWCGAAVIGGDPAFDAIQKHNEWHRMNRRDARA